MSIVLRLNVMALVLPVLACGMAMAADVGVGKMFQGAYRPATLQPARHAEIAGRGGHARYGQSLGLQVR